MNSYTTHILIAISVLTGIITTVPTYASTIEQEPCPDCGEDFNYEDAQMMRLSDVPIRVWTDRTIYEYGSDINIQGIVANLKDMPITVKVTGPQGNVVGIQQLEVASDRTFEAMILLFANTIILSMPQADAAPFNKFITITRSATCILTDCVSSQTLAKYDNSTQAISGKLVFKSGVGDYIREDVYPNSINWYSANLPDTTIIFYQPDQGTLIRSKQVIITNLDEFSPPGTNQKQSIDSLTDVRVTYKGAYIDPKCTYAMVNMKYYPDLNPIINHLGAGCSGDIGNKIEHVTEKTQLVYCGNHCQYEKFMQDAKSQKGEFQINKGTPRHYTIELKE